MTGGARNGIRSWLVCLYGWVVLVQGCDLLQTREPEQPEGPGSTFIPPTTPTLVITNLENAIKDKNKENYRQCLVDTSFTNKRFQFEPTIQARTRHSLAFSDWTIASEEQYFRNLAASRAGGVSSLDLFDREISQSADSVVIRAKYHLVFQHQDNNLQQEARGTLEFSLVRDRRSAWSIYRWLDFQDTSSTTWSDFKGTFLR